MSDDEDRTLKCAECRKDFVLTVAEQRSFARYGMQQPKRCKACRQARKIVRERRDQVS